VVTQVTNLRRGWLPGLVVGASCGFLFWLFPAAAVLLLVVFLAVAAWQRRFAVGLSGALAGVGGTWLVLLARSVMECARFDAAPGQECVQPDLGAWFMGGVAMLVIGTILAVVGLRRRG
jgi:hypothetical protein